MPITLQNTTIIGITGTLNAGNLTQNGSQVYSRTNIVGSVSQSVGIPTGGIAEAGSNSNGQYYKYADGMQICNLYYTTGTIPAGGFALNWTFPASFATGTNLSARSIGGFPYADYWMFSAQSLSASSLVAFARPGPNSAAAANANGRLIDFQLIVVGRWY